MGCDNSKLDTINKFKERKTPKKKKKNNKKKIIYNSSININPSKENVTNLNTEINNFQINGETNSIDDFHILEKIEDNFEYKTFKCLNKKTKEFQLIYVIYKNDNFNYNLIQSFQKLNYKTLINCIVYFEDEYFHYIITDYFKYNIFDIGLFFTDFNLDKLKKLINDFINCLIYFQKNNKGIIPISSFDNSNLKISQNGNLYLEYIDIFNLISDEIITYKSIEEILFIFSKILIVLFNDEKEQNKFDIFSYENCSKNDIYYYYKFLSEDKRNFLNELINYNSDINNLESILENPFLKTDEKDTKKKIGKNKIFKTFYSEYNLFNSTLKYIQFKNYYNENSEYFKSLFESFEGLSDNKIKGTGISANFWSKLRKRYLSIELNELVSDTLEYDFDHLDYNNFIRCLCNFDSKICKKKLKGDFILVSNQKNFKIKIYDLLQIFYIEVNDHINEIISEVDNDEDHSLSFNEFLYIIYKIL